LHNRSHNERCAATLRLLITGGLVERAITDIGKSCLDKKEKWEIKKERERLLPRFGHSNNACARCEFLCAHRGKARAGCTAEMYSQADTSPHVFLVVTDANCFIRSAMCWMMASLRM
jgi:hypothetical protein